MKKRFVLLFPLFAAAAVAACSTEPGLNFASEDSVLTEIPDPLPADTAQEISPGVLQVRRMIVRPCAGEVLTGKGTRSDLDLTVRISVRNGTGCTNTTPTAHRFLGLFGNLHGGRYHVRVIESFGGTDQQVFETEIDI